MCPLIHKAARVKIAVWFCMFQMGVCLADSGNADVGKSLQHRKASPTGERTGIKRSHLATWFTDTEEYEKFVVDIYVQRMDLISEFEIKKWQNLVRQFHEQGKIVFGILHPLTHVGKIFEYVMDDPGIQDAVCLDFNKNPVVTGWMADRRYKGKPVYLYCTNNPKFRAWLRQQTYMIAAIGADGYHVDDYGGGPACFNSGGCFCQYCMEGFRQYLQEQYGQAGLKSRGIEDIESFDYRDVVLRYADDTKSFQLAVKNREIPLIEL